MLPCIPAKRCAQHVVDDYKLHCQAEKLRGIGRSSFYKIFKKLTVGSEKLVNAVDYVTASCVNELVHTIQCMLDYFLQGRNKADYEDCTNKLEITKNFLKIQCNSHIRQNDDRVCTHGVGYCLGKSCDDDAVPEPRD